MERRKPPSASTTWPVIVAASEAVALLARSGRGHSEPSLADSLTRQWPRHRYPLKLEAEQVAPLAPESVLANDYAGTRLPLRVDPRAGPIWCGGACERRPRIPRVLWTTAE